MRLPDTKPSRKEKQDEEAWVLRKDEGIANKKMDDYDSGGGRSADKGTGAEDEGSTAPLPEKVSLSCCFRERLCLDVRNCGKLKESARKFVFVSCFA